jgi:hypothetical protein
MQRRTTVDVNPNIAGILSLFDPALDWSADLSGDEYESVLKEFLVVNQEGSKDPRKDKSLKGDEIEAIREEWQRVRKNKNLEYRVAKKIISAQKLLGSSGITPPQSEGGGGDLVVIKEKVVSIEKILGDQFKFQEGQAKDAKQEAEKKRRSLKERLLAGAKNIWGGIEKVAGAVIKPFQSIWSKILGFLQTIILGRIFVKLLEWAGKKENQKKIKSIFKFLKDWWPTLLASYILFGTGFTRFVGNFVRSIIGGTKKLLALIPLLRKAIKKIATSKILKGLTRFLGGGKGKFVSGGLAKTTQLSLFSGGGLVEEREPIAKYNEGGLVNNYHNHVNQGGIVNNYINKYKEGGFVSGPSGVDKVPAKLTAGEFVMSKGAVQKYGVDTLAAMNAAGGGTNIPTLMGGFQEGGVVGAQGTQGAQGIQGTQGAQGAQGIQGTQGSQGISGSDVVNKGLQGKGLESGGSGIISSDTSKMVNMNASKYSLNKDVTKEIQKISSTTNITPLSKGKTKVTVIEGSSETDNDPSDADLESATGREIPSFDATIYRSLPKMEVLGISV